jgi:uncharacterized protein YwgA
MNTTPETRVAILARMVKGAPGHSLGRTQIMKLFYFLQELKGVPLGYDFRLFNYGPFDSEVLSDLSSACGQDTVVEKSFIYTRGYGYDITPGANADKVCQSLEDTDPELVQKVEEVIQEFGAFTASELELRSTILFVDREFAGVGQGVASDALVERVRQIKPHFDNETIQKRVADMAGRSYLQSLTPYPSRVS